MKVEVRLIVNGLEYSATVEPSTSLISLLRDHLGLTGTNLGCGTGECGACTVLVDGRATNSCLMLAVDAAGKQVTTIEGLETPEGLDPVQEAFLQEGAVQCGYCTPGMVMLAKDFLKNDPNPTDDGIRAAISGNLCRCTGYQKIVKAIKTAKEIQDINGGGGE